MRLPLALCLFAALAGPSLVSAAAKPPPKAAAKAGAAAWIVDKAASRLELHSSVAGMPVAGGFRRWDAQISFDPKALAAARATVSVDTGSAFTGDSSRDDTLKTADWFDVPKFPRATFVTRRFRDLGGGRYEAVGDLTIRGVTHPVTLPFTLAITGDTARMNGSVDVERQLFGVGQGQFRAADTVPFKVNVQVKLLAHRAH